MFCVVYHTIQNHPKELGTEGKQEVKAEGLRGTREAIACKKGLPCSRADPCKA